MVTGRTFASFFQAGFECSSHRRKDGVRLDLIRATAHDRHALGDYRQCAELGLRTIRDGLRWHRIETAPGRYDWSSWLPMLEAAEEAGVQVIWDLFHYGAPDHVDLAGPDFAKRFADFAVAALEVRETVRTSPPLVCPLNEINFLSWAVDHDYIPVAGGSSENRFKHQLVGAWIAAVGAIRERWPLAVVVGAEPLIHVAPHNRRRETVEAAEANRAGMFEAFDWITGRAEPELGGSPAMIDVVGWNYYPHNQWFRDGPTIPMGHHEYRALAEMLVEVFERYEKPLFLAETGAEGSARPAWFHYVCDEVREAQRRGVEIEGICIYPVTAYPGWDNSRHCDVGLLSTIGAEGRREVDPPMRAELERQREIFEKQSPDTSLRIASSRD